MPWVLPPRHASLKCSSFIIHLAHSFTIFRSWLKYSFLKESFLLIYLKLPLPSPHCLSHTSYPTSLSSILSPPWQLLIYVTCMLFLSAGIHFLLGHGSFSVMCCELPQADKAHKHWACTPLPCSKFSDVGLVDLSW